MTLQGGAKACGFNLKSARTIFSREYKTSRSNAYAHMDIGQTGQPR